MSTTGRGDDHRITRVDIEAKLREIRGSADDAKPNVADHAQRTGIMAAGALAVLGAFVLGRRRGRKKSTIVEIRRT